MAFEDNTRRAARKNYYGDAVAAMSAPGIAPKDAPAVQQIPPINSGPGQNAVNALATIARMADGGMLDPTATTASTASAPPAAAVPAPADGGWQARMNLQNAQTGASSIVNSQSRLEAQNQVKSMTAPVAPAVPPSLTASPLPGVTPNSSAVSARPSSSTTLPSAAPASGLIATPSASVAPGLSGGLNTNGSIKQMYDRMSAGVKPSGPDNSFNMADGGTAYVKGSKDGGRVIGPGTGTSDSVPARYSNGEYVLPADTAAAIGHDKLDQIRAATHTPVAGYARGFKPVYHLANGGSLYPYNMPDKDIYAGFGKPSSAPENTPLPGSITGGAARLPPLPSVRPKAQAQLAAPPLDAQAAADRETASGITGTLKDANQRAGAAIADVATLIPRGLAGAYDTAVVRPMRAAGINAGYMSPLLAPAGSSPASQTPFYDRVRAQDSAQSAMASTTPSIPQPASVPATPKTDVQRGGAASATAAAPQAVTAPTSPNTPSGNVTRTGNSYSGGNVAGDITINGQAPGNGGFISAQNMDAAQALSDRHQTSAAAQPAMGFSPPATASSENNWQKRNDLRNLEVSASSIVNNQGFGGRRGLSPAQQAYQAALGQDIQARYGADAGSVTAAKEFGDTQRAGIQDTTARRGQDAALNTSQAASKLAQQEFGLKRQAADTAQTAAGFQNRQAAQAEQLRNVLLDPNATPEQRKVAQRSLSALSGKTAADRMQTVNLPDTTNELGGVVRGGQALIRTLEDGTVEQVPIGAQQAKPPTPRTQYDALKKGEKYTGTDGKQYIKG